MPIDNTVFGVWKTFWFTNPSTGISSQYIVESSNETVKQDVNNKYYIMGTAMPRILAIQGAEATLDITAPLLVAQGSNATLPPTGNNRTGIIGTDPVNDGFTLVSTLGSYSYMSPTYIADPGFIFQNMSFSVSADQGATYKISAVGDYDALSSEGYVNRGYTQGFGISNTPTTLPEGQVFRVASFYDFDVSIGGWTLGPSSGVYLRDLTVEAKYNTEPFNYVGQPDQRKYHGISTYDITVKGTLISQTRVPRANPAYQPYDMPLQAATKDAAYPANYVAPLYGGFAIPTTGTFSVILRNNGGIGVLPAAVINPLQKFIFTSTTLQAQTGLLTTSFEGKLWATTNS